MKKLILRILKWLLIVLVSLIIFVVIAWNFFLKPPPYSEAMQDHSPLGTVTGQLATLPAPTTTQNRFDDAIEYAAEMDSYSLLIWHDGQLVLEKYFDSHTADLRPESASMHKSVLGLLIAAAIADGHIGSADERVGLYLPEWNDDARGDITIRQLLTMSSGLAPLSREGFLWADAFKYVDDGAAARSMTLGLPLQDKPGEVFHYANTSSQLLLTILENATQRPYAEYLSERLWKPIGADDAYVWNNEANGYPRGYSALMARARDWVKIGLLIKNKGQHLGTQIIPEELMEAYYAPSKANKNYGWQVWLGTEHNPQRYYNAAKSGISVPSAEPFKTDDMIYLDGFGGQRVYISPSHDLVIVRQGDLRMSWDDTALPNMVIDKIK